MSSPLSGILACLFLEFLEREHILNKLPPNSLHLIYIEEILLIYPDKENLSNITDTQNKIEKELSNLLMKMKPILIFYSSAIT